MFRLHVAQKATNGKEFEEGVGCIAGESIVVASVVGSVRVTAMLHKVTNPLMYFPEADLIGSDVP